MTDKAAGERPEISRAEMMEAIWKQTRLTGHVIERLKHEIDRVIEHAHHELVPDRDGGPGWPGPEPWPEPPPAAEANIAEVIRTELTLLIPALVKKEVDAQFRHLTETLQARLLSGDRTAAQKIRAVRSRKGH
jgi:hypothetical protein